MQVMDQDAQITLNDRTESVQQQQQRMMSGHGLDSDFFLAEIQPSTAYVGETARLQLTNKHAEHKPMSVTWHLKNTAVARYSEEEFMTNIHDLRNIQMRDAGTYVWTVITTNQCTASGEVTLTVLPRPARSTDQNQSRFRRGADNDGDDNPGGNPDNWDHHITRQERTSGPNPHAEPPTHMDKVEVVDKVKDAGLPNKEDLEEQTLAASNTEINPNTEEMVASCPNQTDELKVMEVVGGTKYKPTGEDKNLSFLKTTHKIKSTEYMVMPAGTTYMYKMPGKAYPYFNDDKGLPGGHPPGAPVTTVYNDLDSDSSCRQLAADMAAINICTTDLPPSMEDNCQAASFLSISSDVSSNSPLPVPDPSKCGKTIQDLLNNQDVMHEVNMLLTPCKESLRLFAGYFTFITETKLKFIIATSPKEAAREIFNEVKSTKPRLKAVVILDALYKAKCCDSIETIRQWHQNCPACQVFYDRI